MEIGNERTDVAHTQRFRTAFEPAIAPHQSFHILVPELLVRIVHRQVTAVVGDTNIGMREQEFTDRRVECEAVDALPRGVYQHRARTIDDVTRRNLTTSWLQQVLHLAVSAARDLRSEEHT